METDETVKALFALLHKEDKTDAEYDALAWIFGSIRDAQHGDEKLRQAIYRKAA